MGFKIGKMFKSVVKGIGKIGKSFVGIAGKALGLANPLGAFFNGLQGLTGSFASKVAAPATAAAGASGGSDPLSAALNNPNLDASTKAQIQAQKAVSDQNFATQMAIQTFTEQRDAKSNILKTLHDSARNIIANFK